MAERQTNKHEMASASKTKQKPINKPTHAQAQHGTAFVFHTHTRDYPQNVKKSEDSK